MVSFQLATHSNGEDGNYEGVAVAEDEGEGGWEEGYPALHQAWGAQRDARRLQGDPQD